MTREQITLDWLSSSSNREKIAIIGMTQDAFNQMLSLPVNVHEFPLTKRETISIYEINNFLFRIKIIE